jgi:hypothetical protein
VPVDLRSTSSAVLSGPVNRLTDAEQQRVLAVPCVLLAAPAALPVFAIRSAKRPDTWAEHVPG